MRGGGEEDVMQMWRITWRITRSPDSYMPAVRWEPRGDSGVAVYGYRLYKPQREAEVNCAMSATVRVPRSAGSHFKWDRGSTCFKLPDLFRISPCSQHHEERRRIVQSLARGNREMRRSAHVWIAKMRRLGGLVSSSPTVKGLRAAELISISDYCTCNHSMVCIWRQKIWILSKEVYAICGSWLPSSDHHWTVVEGYGAYWTKSSLIDLWTQVHR
jgi:hypothetical protein